MKFRILIVLLLIQIPFIGLTQQIMSAAEYVNTYRILAVQEMLDYRIPASITLAQGLIETSNGNSNLARLANNHFGIKCHKEWTGPTYHQDDDSANECFRLYDNVEASYRDHSLFLTSRPRYAGLFSLQITDYEGWARGLRAAGYATNPTYAEQLIKVIREHNLNYYDTLAYIPIDWAKEPLFVDNLDIHGDDQIIEEEEVLLRPAGDYELKHFNRINYVEARTGDTPKQIAEALDLMVWQVCKYNDVEKSHVFRTNERVFIQPKRNKGSAETHILQEGETMRDISQNYGLKLSKLYSRNGLVAGSYPHPGTLLRLR